MQKFYIGDIVKFSTVVTGKVDNTLYIVTDVADFSTEKIVDIDYELAQIFPINIVTKYSTVGQDELFLHAGRLSKDRNGIIDFVMQERKMRGIYNTPDYIVNIGKNIVEENKRKKETERDTVVVRYDLMTTINECLDAYNDLSELHRTFGDESYLQLRDEVEKRLKELIV